MKKIEDILNSERIWGHTIVFPVHSAGSFRAGNHIWHRVPDCGYRTADVGTERTVRLPGISRRLHHRPGLRREALSESGAGAALRERCVSADTYGTGAGESERIMRCEAAAELPGGSSG